MIQASFCFRYTVTVSSVEQHEDIELPLDVPGGLGTRSRRTVTSEQLALEPSCYLQEKYTKLPVT